MKFRVRSAAGGAGKVEWLPSPSSADKARSVAFQVAGGDWQEFSVDLPSDGPLGILRLYLPAQTEAVQLDWIELQSGREMKRTDF